VTKPWTAVGIFQAVERGELSLDDAASRWVDPVLDRLWKLSLVGLWGADAASVRVRDLLGMTSGFADYDDFIAEHWTIRYSGDDVGPQLYLLSASKRGFVCKPRTCATYSGANYILLGIVLVQLAHVWSWQDFSQLSVIPQRLWATDRYSQTSFLHLGRCIQYPGVAHQFAWNYWRPEPLPQRFDDLAFSSCLNGWTMGNIASTGRDLATFFYDLFTLAPEEGGFLNATSLQAMQDFKRLNDTWCQGPSGYGSCTYGMGLLSDQVGQDVWSVLDGTQGSASDVRILGHPGEDWGSGCSPCGYNPKFGFGICMAYTSVIGMNCSGDFRVNYNAVQEATCRAYDAVLAAAGGPRLNRTLPPLEGAPVRANCSWRRDVIYNETDDEIMELVGELSATTSNIVQGATVVLV